MPTLDDLTAYSNWSGLTRPYIVGNDSSGTQSTTYKFRAYDMFDNYLAHKMGSHYDSSTIPNLDSHICWLLFNDSQYAHDYGTPLVDAYLSNYSYLNAEAISAADIITSSYLSQCYIPLYYENTLYKVQASDISGGGGGGDFAQDMVNYLESLTSSPSYLEDDSCCFLATTREGDEPSRLQLKDCINRFFHGRASFELLTGTDKLYVGRITEDSYCLGQITIDQLISYINTHS